MRSVNLVVIHCSASQNGVFISAAQIDNWHRQNGFKRDAKFAREFRPHLPHIGYHRLILADGSIGFGRDVDEVGAHVAKHNDHSIGVCMTGMNAYFLHQWEALRAALCALAVGLADRAKLPAPPGMPGVMDALAIYERLGVRIVGHRDLSPDLDGDGVIERHEWLKTCPGFDVATWLSHGMEPESIHVLDDHPAISQASPTERAWSSIRSWV